MKVTMLMVTMLACLLLQLAHGQGTKCSQKEYNRFDELVAKLTGIGKHGRQFPASTEQFDVYCREVKEDTKEMEELTKRCYDQQTKQFLSIIIYSLKGAIKKNCGRKSTKRLNQLLAMGKCTNKASPKLTNCMTNFVDKLEGTLVAKKDIRLPLVCCNYYKTLECISNTIRPECPEQAEAVTDFVRALMQNIADVSCGEYTEQSDKCAGIVSKTPKALKSKSTNYKSFLLPLSNVWDTLN